MPVVVVKGGATAGGARAAASHTGSLATDDRIFDGMCRQAGVTRAATVEEAFEAAATFATQPLPTGNRVVVMTTAGGWGVVTADAITRHPDLELAALPDDLRDAIDTKLPPRWSRNNPVDLAGGETRDTIPEVMELIAAHPDVDAIVYLGLGIQSNQARMLREGPFYPDHGLERIVAYHERQDARFAQAAHDISVATGKPILTATELAVAVPGQPRTGDGAGHRTALLRLGGPGRRGVGSPVATQPVPPAAGPAPDMTDGPDPLSDEVVAPVVRARHRAAADRPGGGVTTSTGGRHRGRWLVAAGVLAVLGLAVGAAAFVFPEQTAVADGTGPDLVASTPVLSARRAPELLARPVAARNLQAAVAPVLARFPADACVEVADGTTALVAQQDTVPLAPASNMKLLTAAAALDVLGPDTRLSTRFAAAAAPVGGTVAGDLFVVGGGDPLLTTDTYAARQTNGVPPATDLEAVADQLVAAGVTRDHRLRRRRRDPLRRPAGRRVAGPTASWARAWWATWGAWWRTTPGRWTRSHRAARPVRRRRTRPPTPPPCSPPSCRPGACRWTAPRARAPPRPGR